MVRFESGPKLAEGMGEKNTRRLVVNTLRTRPDRIIVGECRLGEALYMIQAMLVRAREGSLLRFCVQIVVECGFETCDNGCDARNGLAGTFDCLVNCICS
jgi:pilus assembly protein CpaF